MVSSEIAIIGLFISIIVLLVVLLIEMANHKRTKKALRRSEEKYRFDLAGAIDGLWNWNIQTETVFYSDRYRNILGYSSEELPSTIDSFLSLIHPEDTDTVRTAIERHLQDSIPFNVEHRMQTRSGKYLWFMNRGQAVRDSEGKATLMSGWIQDITKRKEADINLKTALSQIGELKDQLESEKGYLQEEIKRGYSYENIIGQSDGLNYVLFKVEQIAPTDTNVLLLGETGTGKELVARAIHGLSLRKDRAFVKVSCATLPSNLIESELFGHEKGAFTGAHSRQLGRFEVANGATLFLDEIGELPLELQPKLLRVLQDGEFERLGSSSTINVNTRIIAATNANLEEKVRRNEFREDLWYRLNVFPITLPPLRERIDDLPLLVDYFVEKMSIKRGKSIECIPTSVINTLSNYDWPGNIRELENIIERAVINSPGAKLQLMDDLQKDRKNLPAQQKTLEEIERNYILSILEQTNWKISGKNGAEKILGLDRSTLRARMRKLGISRP